MEEVSGRFKGLNAELTGLKNDDVADKLVTTPAHANAGILSVWLVPTSTLLQKSQTSPVELNPVRRFRYQAESK